MQHKPMGAPAKKEAVRLRLEPPPPTPSQARRPSEGAAPERSSGRRRRRRRRWRRRRRRWAQAVAAPTPRWVCDARRARGERWAARGWRRCSGGGGEATLLSAVAMGGGDGGDGGGDGGDGDGLKPSTVLVLICSFTCVQFVSTRKCVKNECLTAATPGYQRVTRLKQLAPARDHSGNSTYSFGLLLISQCPAGSAPTLSPYTAISPAHSSFLKPVASTMRGRKRASLLTRATTRISTLRAAQTSGR